MSLVPMFHVAIVEASQILPDMVDLFERLGRDGDRSNFVLISGPSKTADIEMTMVTGVHGPGIVHILLLEASKSLEKSLERCSEISDARS